MRTLFGNPTALPADAAWPLRHCELIAVAWCVLLLAVGMPLAIRRFRTRMIG